MAVLALFFCPTRKSLRVLSSIAKLMNTLAIIVSFNLKIIGSDHTISSARQRIYNNIFVRWFGSTGPEGTPVSDVNASLAFALVFIGVWFFICWPLYVKRIFLKV